jgi:hypothetical protein
MATSRHRTCCAYVENEDDEDLSLSTFKEEEEIADNKLKGRQGKHNKICPVNSLLQLK